MSDLIDRQMAIDALSHMCSEDENGITVSRANVNKTTYGKTIIDFPDQIDPVKLIDEKMRTCPFCNRVVSDDSTPWSKEYKSDYTRKSSGVLLDNKGKEHRFRKKLNKYIWIKYEVVRCGKCYTKWKTDYFPADYKMFEIEVKGDVK